MSDLIRQRAQGVRQASQILAISTEATRNAALDAIAAALETRRDEILAANQKDIEAAEAMVKEGELDAPLLKRLNLGGAKFAATVEMVHSVRAQLDPLGQTQSAIELDSGLDLYRVSVPIGVIGVIFESRPDALVQIACICLKSGNAVLLKGGREAAASNRILAQIIDAATADIDGIPPGWLTLLETREDVGAILDLDHDIDLIIPRGGNEFVQYIMSHTNIPVMGHADGICHVYIDADADLDKAVRIAVDSKTQYVSVCNAAETLLVHQDIAAAFLDRVLPALEKEKVELRGDGRTRSLAGNNGRVIAATQEDWSTEYLDYILSIKVVDNLEEAIVHINTYSSHHTDAIVSEDANAAQQFLRSVDSASVLHNASTRFADGFRYGLGAEVGISTNRLHSRGPVGLEGLTIYKYILQGDGHTVDDFEGDTPKPYTHRSLDKAWRSS